jgi:2-dehydropantoate 2-reductase
MKYVILGAGAVGSALGGLLQEAGARVVFVARGAHLAALRERGLSLGTPSRELRLAVEVVGDVGELRVEPGDVALLCTKSQDSAAALEAFARVAPPETPIVCAQNGVANEGVAARSFRRVHGAVVFSPMAMVEPGRVTIHSEPVLGGLDVGCAPDGSDAVDAALVRDLVAAGFDARVDPRVMRLKHGKLLTNLGNAVEALAGRGTRALVEGLVDEAVACLRAAGIDFASVDEVVTRYAAVRSLPVAGVARGGGSTWQSLARATGSTETDFLNGEVVRLGERHGVPTPKNRAITRLALRAAAERWAPGRLTVAELEAELARG